ncbi:MAG: hypothetical protein AB8G99_06445 [Planctomycetaceae bacterium]
MSDQLYPEPSPFAEASRAHLVQTLLLPEVLGTVTAATVCIPSTDEPPWSLRAYWTDTLGPCISTSAADLELGAHVNTHEIAVSSSLAEKIREVWSRMLRTVSYATRPDRGLDGTSYHFWSIDPSSSVRMAGYVWSPHWESAAAELAAIACDLRKCVAGGTLGPTKQKQLTARLEAFKCPPQYRSPKIEELQRRVDKAIVLFEQGVLHDQEVANFISDSFRDVAWVPLSDILRVCDRVPSAVLAHIRD